MTNSCSLCRAHLGQLGGQQGGIKNSVSLLFLFSVLASCSMDQNIEFAINHWRWLFSFPELSVHLQSCLPRSLERGKPEALGRCVSCYKNKPF
ncbi:hypothetical protein XENTR_v10013271 [Xenopus tropicalis]|nr:hypothetical protein XENTR_v10013271 [Xenopus tropicalis]